MAPISMQSYRQTGARFSILFWKRSLRKRRKRTPSRKRPSRPRPPSRPRLPRGSPLSSRDGRSSRQISSSPATQPAPPSAARNSIRLKRPTPFINGTYTIIARTAVQIAGHVLRGEYTDPENGRRFTIIGLPGWNAQNAAPNSTASARGRSGRSGRAPQQASSGTTRTIRECSRWLTAKRKPPCSYNRNYNGYWLYYFDAESGMPVKATMKSE